VKNTYLDPIYFKAADALFDGLIKMGSVDITVNTVADLMSTPPKLEMGHIAVPCFPFAKSLGKKPQEIAQALADHLKDNPLFSKIEVAGAYLNLFFSGKTYGELVVKNIVHGHLLKIPELWMPPVMVEYSQPNTHKELHVGHMRNLCMGNALVRVLRYSGRPVVSTTFPGDVGTHVAKCLWYMKRHNTEEAPALGKGEWLGRMYSKAHIKLEDEKGTDQEATNREELTAILKQLEQKQGEYYDLWQETRQWSIDLMKKIYKWADVEFDVWYWESEVDSPSVAWINSLYEKGQLEKSQGAVGMNLEDVKLGFCLLLKTDGNGLYATKDLELARRKFENYDPSQSIYVVDMRQELHFKQVFEVLKRIGFEQASKCFHLKYNFVELPDGAMSSRKGNIVPITDLIHQMQDHVKSHYLSRYEGQWSQEDINTTADMVAQGAIKYGMNAMDPNKKIVFKMEEWLKLDGESGPYVQYAHARIQSLIEKNPEDLVSAIDYSLLEHSAELALMNKLSQFQRAIEASAQNLKTSLMCTYVYELAQLFNSFYHDCPIGKADSQELKRARLSLAKATAMVLKQGLGVLGIPAPQKM
jgi:arginyl-tRNA synthetase